jgi:hypothetical protein
MRPTSCVLLLAVACSTPRSPSEACKQRGEAADRCEALAREEQFQAKQLEVEEERALDRQQDPILARELAAVRQAPRAPDLGGGIEDARVACDQQHGRYESVPPNGFCRVGGVRIFTCAVDAKERLSRCDTYHEKADLLAKRAAMEKELGAPEREAEWSGFRVFVWKKGTAAVAGYARGVRVTRATPEAAPPY